MSRRMGRAPETGCYMVVTGDDPRKRAVQSRISLRTPRLIDHQRAPQRLDRRTVTLARPLIPGRHGSSAASRTRPSSEWDGSAVVDTWLILLLSACAAVVLGRRLTGCPVATELAPAPVSAIRTSRVSTRPRRSRTCPRETPCPNSSSGLGVRTWPELTARTLKARI